jgi:hypothetical protein
LAQKIAIAIIMDLLGLGSEPPDPRTWQDPQQAPDVPTVPGPAVSNSEPEDVSKRAREPRSPEEVPPPDQLVDAPQDGTGAADAEALEAAKQRAREAIAKAKAAKQALGSDSLWSDIQAQKKLAEDARKALSDYQLADLHAKEAKQTKEAQQKASGAQPQQKTGEAQQSADAGVFAEAVKGYKGAQLAAEQAVKQVKDQEHEAEVALANAKHEAFVARLERDKLDKEYQHKVADLAWKKYAGDENKAKLELQNEAEELRKANERVEQTEKLMKVASQQGGIADSLGVAVGHRRQNEEAISGAGK